MVRLREWKECNITMFWCIFWEIQWFGFSHWWIQPVFWLYCKAAFQLEHDDNFPCRISCFKWHLHDRFVFFRPWLIHSFQFLWFFESLLRSSDPYLFFSAWRDCSEAGGTATCNFRYSFRSLREQGSFYSSFACVKVDFCRGDLFSSRVDRYIDVENVSLWYWFLPFFQQGKKDEFHHEGTNSCWRVWYPSAAFDTQCPEATCWFCQQTNDPASGICFVFLCWCLNM